jgi:SulP family sulfate permease
VSAAVPGWLRSYERSWLRPDLIAGLVIWSVVTPQAVAYAQIAGLPPEAGLMAAPVAMLAYALLGTSRQLVVSATTATSAVSAATVGPLADGDPVRFAALSAALALVVAVVLVLGGLLRFGAISDLVSKPVMTGFLFGLGMVIALAQLPSLLGIKPGEGNFFPALWDVLGELDAVQGTTLAVGAASLAVLILGKRVLPGFPSTLLVLVLAIVSALAGLQDHGVDVVGAIPTALPDPAIPDVAAGDLVELIAPALGVLVLTARRSASPAGSPCATATRSIPTATSSRWAPRTRWRGCRRASCSRAARARPRRPTAPAAAARSPPWWRPG